MEEADDLGPLTRSETSASSPRERMPYPFQGMTLRDEDLTPQPVG